MNQPLGRSVSKPAWELSAVALALGLSGIAAPASAADEVAVQEQLRRLGERLQQLEQRNKDLERQVKDLSGAAAPAGTWGAASDAQLKALQQRVDGLAPASDAEAAAPDEGPKFKASLLTVGQNVNAKGSADGRSRTRLNTRGDVSVELPGGSIGEAQGSAFAALRFGQGTGVALRPTHTSTVNSVAFESAGGSDETYAIVAQAWYQLEWALGADGFNGQRGSRVEMTIGKLDMFGFFDQNAVAGDEAGQFLNNAFVHNPLLDSGGDIVADAYGLAPGVRLGYANTGDGSLTWSASLGVFGAGAGANYNGGLGKPLTIVQFELSPMLINGEPRASYRVYAWTNGRTSDLAGNEQRHSGIGVSINQQIGRDWNLFGRWGRRTSGEGNFDSALTVGFEHGGRAWGRGKDALGFALGALHTDKAWRGATADGALVGYAASGNERIAELYYRMKLNDHLDVSPDFQLIQRAGGDGTAPSVRVLGLRASLGF